MSQACLVPGRFMPRGTPAAEEESLRWLVKAGFRLQLPCRCGGSFGACSSPAPVFTKCVGTSYLWTLGP